MRLLANHDTIKKDLVELNGSGVAAVVGGRCCVCYCSRYPNIAIGYNTIEGGNCSGIEERDYYCYKRCVNRGYRYSTWLSQDICAL